MALDENRSKYDNNLSNLLSLIWRFVKKLLVVALCVLCVELLYLSPSNQVVNATLEYSGKVIDFGRTIYDKLLKPIRFVKNEFHAFSELKTENIELKVQLEKYKNIEEDVKLLESENKELRKILHVVPDAKYNKKTVRLLSISSNPFSKTILIGAGSNDGVVIDQIVTADNGLLGRIIQVSDNYSKVMLITDSNSRIPVISSISRERGILNGENDKLGIAYFTDPKSIKEGETLLTSGDGKIFPYGIPVAEVINNDDGKILLKPIVDLNNTEFVNIYNIKNSK